MRSARTCLKRLPMTAGSSSARQAGDRISSPSLGPPGIHFDTRRAPAESTYQFDGGETRCGFINSYLDHRHAGLQGIRNDARGKPVISASSSVIRWAITSRRSCRPILPSLTNSFKAVSRPTICSLPTLQERPIPCRGTPGRLRLSTRSMGGSHSS